VLNTKLPLMGPILKSKLSIELLMNKNNIKTYTWNYNIKVCGNFKLSQIPYNISLVINSL
jgi:hypothetical protein